MSKIYSLIPSEIVDNNDTHMKAVVLMITLLFNGTIGLMAIPFLLYGFDGTPIIAQDGLTLVYICLISYLLSFIALNRLSMLNVAGNIAQVGIYISAIITSWHTGGIFSPMMFLLLVPPVFAFVLTNLASGLVWSFITICTFFIIWGLDEYEIPIPWVSEDIAFPLQMIIDGGDFSRLCIAVPLLTCISIIGVVVTYEINTLKMREMLSQERNLFAFKASHDPLTGLANRAEFDSRIQRDIAAAWHSSYSLALIYIDLDGFKPINDDIGHHAGDTVLQVISKRLEHTVRNTDMVARLGGDEFAILLQGIGKDSEIKHVIEKLLSVISEDISIDGDMNVNVNGSLGVAYYPHDADTPDKLCRYADMAMYLAKEDKNTWKTYQQVQVSEQGNNT